MIKNKIIKLSQHGDRRGSLISLEKESNVPFEIARVYYIFDTKKNVSRGYHAHKKLEQMLICVKGTCDLILDDGHQQQKYELSAPDIAVHITPGVWREMHNFSEDCVLMVLASHVYEESDYIRDYQEFINYVRN